MRNKLGRSFAIAAIAGFALFGAAAPATALSSDTTGSEAYGNSSGEWRVYDTKCDGDSAYGKFIEQGASGIQRRDVTSGCNTNAGGDLGNAVTSVQACRNTTLAPDNCGGWNEW